jgi:hypothetical protein
MTPSHSLPTNATSSSISITLEVHSSPKINYFAILSSDSDEWDDEFDPYIISYPSNFIVNEFLNHSKVLTYFDSSTKFFKVRILELEKMINIYQYDMDGLKRMKFKLSKYKGENIILNVQIWILKTKNRTLKISDELKYIIILNLELVYGIRISHNKSKIKIW